MSWYSMCDYKHFVDKTLRRVNDDDGSIVDTLITGYVLDYDDLFRQTDGHAGCMIHRFDFADDTSYTFSSIRSVIAKYGEPITSENKCDTIK